MAVWINLHEWYLEPREEWKALNASINDLYSLKWSYIEKQKGKSLMQMSPLPKFPGS